MYEIIALSYIPIVIFYFRFTLTMFTGLNLHYLTKFADNLRYLCLIAKIKKFKSKECSHFG